MAKTSKIKGKAMTIPGGLAYSAAVSLTMTILLSAITAAVLEKGILSFEHSGYAVMMILFFAAMTGGVVSAARIKHQILAVCIGSGILYFLILLSITALFYGGQYCAVGETTAVIAAGTAVAAAFSLRKMSWKPKRR